MEIPILFANILGKALLHEGAGGGALAGLLHPLLGMDHLLAMVTVGLLSSQIGGRAIWTVPATFVSVMAAGGILGLMDVPLPLVEMGIALSVLVLGIALAAKRQMPAGIAMVFVGFFAIFHGHAHGVELPELSNTFIEIVMYVFGFLVATAGLHLVGALVGQIVSNRPKGDIIMRLGGVLISIAGLFLIFNL